MEYAYLSLRLIHTSHCPYVLGDVPALDDGIIHKPTRRVVVSNQRLLTHPNLGTLRLPVRSVTCFMKSAFHGPPGTTGPASEHDP